MNYLIHKSVIREGKFLDGRILAENVNVKVFCIFSRSAFF